MDFIVPIALVLGLLIGWILEWIFDWLFWRTTSTSPAKSTPLKSDENIEEDLLAELVDLRVKLHNLQNSTADSEELKRLRDKLAAAEAMIVALGTQVARTQQVETQNTALQSDLDMIAAQANASSAMRVQLTAAQTEIDGLRARVIEAEQWRKKALEAEAELNKLRGDSKVMPPTPAVATTNNEPIITDLLAKLAAAEARAAQLPIAEAMLTTLGAQLHEAHNEATGWQQRYEESDAAFNKLWKEMGDDKQKISQLASSGSPVVSADTQKLTTDLADAQRRITQLTEYEFEFNHLKTQLSELDHQRTRVTDLEFELELAQSELANAKGQPAVAATPSDEAAQLKTELAQSAQIIHDFEASIGQFRAERDNSEDLIDRLRLERDQMETELNQLKEVVNQLRMAQASGDTERPAARTVELEAEVTRLRTLETDYEAQRRRILELESQVERLRNKSDDTSQSRLTMEVERLQQILAKHNQTVNDYETQLKELRSTNVQQDRALDKLRDAQDEDEKQIAALEAEVKEGREAPDTPLTSKEGDDFQLIKGIGPSFAKRLRAVGIKTYAELARYNNEELRALLKVQKWQRFEGDAWVAQAIELAGEKLTKEKKKRK